MSFTLKIVLAVLGALGVIVVVTSFERPPVNVVQVGQRGTAMELVANPRTIAAQLPRHAVPEPTPPVDAAGQKASEVYENVQVLGDLDANAFTRLMVAITAWVSPEQGCNYCHNPENLASDEVYTKVVTRRMLQMTRTINASWQAHVGQTGVTCYTCHRGRPVPEEVWATDPDPRRTRGIAASAAGQNIASPAVGLSSLPHDPFTPFLLRDDPIRVTGTRPLPHGNPATIMGAEWTYGLMFHFSAATGQNCTFCHNTQNFGKWETSTPQRVIAWHGIRMVRAVNNGYIEPLRPLWAANPHGPPERGDATQSRLGPGGDPWKVNCGTCHLGANKPLLGRSMLADYPELNAVTLGPLRAAAR
jgi:photosynthetic reaction center cytochrome c subunit